MPNKKLDVGLAARYSENDMSDRSVRHEVYRYSTPSELAAHGNYFTVQGDLTRYQADALALQLSRRTGESHFVCAY